MAEQDFVSNVRWLVTNPGLLRPQAFFTERTALRKSEAVAEATNNPSRVIRQELVKGEWVNADGTREQQQTISVEDLVVRSERPWKLFDR